MNVRVLSSKRVEGRLYQWELVLACGHRLLIAVAGNSTPAERVWCSKCSKEKRA